MKLDTSAPSAPTGFAFSAVTQAYYPGTGSTVYFQSGGTGGFTVTASGAADAQSGVSSYGYGRSAAAAGRTPAAPTPSRAPPARPRTARSPRPTAPASPAPSTTFTAEADGTAPTSSVLCNTAACIAGWYSASPVTVDISAGGETGASGVKQITYTTDGSDPTSSGTATTVAANSASFDITALGTTTVKWVAEDNVGNVSTVSSQDVKLDTTAP